MSHTPGEWLLDEVDDNPRMQFIRTNRGERETRIAVALGDVDCSPSEQNANARLIAAAPELLEAVEALVAGVDDCDIESIRPRIRIDILIARLTRARDAIAKAKGDK